MLRTFVLSIVLLGPAAAEGPMVVDLCKVLATPAKYAGAEITVRATIRSSMHGTYLSQAGCDDVLFMALPAEIPNRKGGPEVERDSSFKAFELARSDYRPDAPRFTASFTGELEYAKHGKGFGYYGRNKTRLVVRKVADVDQQPVGLAENEPAAVKATFCDLAQHPEQYMGKMVEVRASVAGNDLWIDDFAQKPACPSWMGVILVLPERVMPKPDFDVVRNDPFSQLFDDLRKRMNVQATLEGRFEAVYTWTNHKQVWIGEGREKSKRFGKKGQYGGRIVLRRVSDILARPVPRR
jgi:hypothetical protein